MRVELPAIIALGSNLGDRESTLRAAVAAIDRLPGVAVTAASALVESAALTFVLVPWLQIQPDARIPGRGLVADLARAAVDAVTPYAAAPLLERPTPPAGSIR